MAKIDVRITETVVTKPQAAVRGIRDTTDARKPLTSLPFIPYYTYNIWPV